MPVLKSWLQSSQNPDQISSTVRGAVLSASAVIMFVAAQVFHIQLGAQDIVALGTELGAIAGGVWFLYGLIFKGVVRLGTVRQ